MNYFLAVNDRQLGSGKILKGGDADESQIQNVLSGLKKRRHMDDCYQRIRRRYSGSRTRRAYLQQMRTPRLSEMQGNGL